MPEVRLLPLAELQAWKFQQRFYHDPEEIKILAESILKEGVKLPLSVRPAKDSDPPVYDIIQGERRWRAANMAVELAKARNLPYQDIEGIYYENLELVPCYVRAYGDREAMREHLLENLLRQDLNSFEEVAGALKLFEFEYGWDEENTYRMFQDMEAAAKKDKRNNVHSAMDNPDFQKVEEIASLLGFKWRSFYNNKLSVYRDAPDHIKEALKRGQISFFAVKPLLKVEDLEASKKLLASTIQLSWSSSAIAKEVNKYLKQSQGSTEPQTQLPTLDSLKPSQKKSSNSFIANEVRYFEAKSRSKTIKSPDFKAKFKEAELLRGEILDLLKQYDRANEELSKFLESDSAAN